MGLIGGRGIRPAARAALPAVLAGMVGIAAPATAQVPLTLESMNDGVSLRNLRFSPSGDRLLVVSDRSGPSKIWVMAADGSDARTLLEDGSESSAEWSPDGSRIAFLRSDDGRPDIWVVDAAGGEAARVTDDEAGERAIEWSPDGRSIAFMSDREGHQDAFTVDVATGEIRQVTSETNPWDEGRWAPEWSPDGRSMVYVSNRSGTWSDDLWAVELATGEHRKLTADIHVMSNPVWSPDGRHVAFNGMAESEFWYGDQSDVYLVEMPAGTVRRLETNTFVSDRNGSVEMRWHPDARRLLFRREWEGDTNLWAVGIDDGVATKMTYESGSFGDFTVAGDGSSVAYVRSTPVRAGEIHRFDLDGGAPRVLTDWALDYRGLRSPRRITFPARDGKYMLGYLSLPPDFDEAASYPALVQVHGGGNNAHGNGFHALEHLLAHEGFVVLAIEYRGSAGHGRAFQDLSLGDWAAGQGWDAVAAAEYLRAQPWSNGRIGIYGGSYGGIMTLAALTRTSEPFAAAAPLYGIYDWADAYEHADRLMRFWVIEGHEGFEPGEAPARYERTATIRNLDPVPTDLPFLVMHGELDRRAPYQQSVRLVEALEARGNPVQFHSYPDERHGFRRRENRIDAYGRLIDFFREHLAPSGS